MSLMEGLEVARKAAEMVAALGGLGIVGKLLGPAMRWLSAGRRMRTASLVAQLAQEVLVGMARKRGIPASDVASLEEAVEELVKRLVAVGVDPVKAPAVARQALAGAQDPRDMSRRALLADQ
jgi:hypothetical protein